MPIIECIPNFSEGRDREVIWEIAQAIDGVENVKLLHIDSGYSANRSVYTFAGEPEAVIEAAFRAIKVAAQRIDMGNQKGIHPRIGAADVCPLVPVEDISMEEVKLYAEKLARRVGEELKISVFMYEESARRPERKNLANIRQGQYEGLEKKMRSPDWQPDFGPVIFSPRLGATVIGAREFLIAYNVNIATNDLKVAWKIAREIRESGQITISPAGSSQHVPGMCKGVKAIAWYIPEFQKTQVSLNITDIQATPMHTAFDTCRKLAEKYGTRVSGSELIGLVPLASMMEAGIFFLDNNRNAREDVLIKAAVEGMGLDEIGLFDTEVKILEYALLHTREFLIDHIQLRK